MKMLATTKGGYVVEVSYREMERMKRFLLPPERRDRVVRSRKQKPIEPTARELLREMLLQRLADRHMTATDAARAAGIAPSTVLRFLNDRNHRFMFTLSTLMKLEGALGELRINSHA